MKLRIFGFLTKSNSLFATKIRPKFQRMERGAINYFYPLFQKANRKVARTTTSVLLIAVMFMTSVHVGDAVTGGSEPTSLFASGKEVTKEATEEVTASLAYYTSQPVLPEVIQETYGNVNGELALAGTGVIATRSSVGTDGEGWAAEVSKYKVRKGDTLSGIAHKFKVTTESLYWLNGIKNADVLKIGQAINIPPVSGLYHSVKKGETIGSIAKKYSVERADIINYNDLAATALKVGSKLLIPGASKSIPRARVKAPSFSGGFGGRYGSSAPKWGGGNFIYPTRCCGYNGYHWWALDIPGASGSPIWAADSGRITTAKYGYNGGYGNYIVIDHGNGFQTLYAHNSSLAITGGYVSKGQIIAYMGCTGRTWGRNGCGIHLHFEIHKNGAKQNPSWYF